MIIGTLQRLNQLDSSPELTPYAIVVDGQEVKRVKLVKYLGVMVDDKLVWDQHIDYISSKIIRGIGIYVVLASSSVSGTSYQGTPYYFFTIP